MLTQKLDAIDVEIIRASLEGIVLEMQNSLFRTGYSTIIRESQDASCAILDANGKVVYRVAGVQPTANWEAMLEAARTGKPPTGQAASGTSSAAN